MTSDPKKLTDLLIRASLTEEPMAPVEKRDPARMASIEAVRQDMRNRGLDVVERILCRECRRPIAPGTGILIEGHVYSISLDIDERYEIIGGAMEGGRLPLIALHTNCFIKLVSPASKGGNLR